MRPGYDLRTQAWTPLSQLFPIISSNKKIYFADQADQKVTNGNLETWTSATVPGTWSVSLGGTSTVNREGTTKYAGTYGARFDIDASNNQARIYQNVTLVAGAVYILSLWYKNSVAGKTSTLRVVDAVANQSLTAAGGWTAGSVAIVIPNATAWTNIKIKFTMTANTVLQVLIGHNSDVSSAASSSIYMDEFYICPQLTATLTEATYTLAGLLAEIKSQMEAVGAATYTISELAGIFTITSSAFVYLYLTTTADALWPTIGFSVLADADFAASHSGSTSMTNVGYSASLSFHEIVEMQFDGATLTKTTSLALVMATPGTWWQDYWGGMIYVHTAAGDDPGESISGDIYLHSIVVFFWIGMANAQFTGAECLDFIPTGCTIPIFYEPWLSAESLGSMSASVADHYSSAMEIQFGSISFINNGWWYQYRHVYLWNNKDVRIKVGAKGDAYASFETIFVGRIRNLTINDSAASFELVDNRVGALYSLPTKRYALADYPNLEQNSIDKPIPILFGEKTNITPTKIDSVNFVFKISDTVWDGVTFALQSIDAVYKAGMMLTVAVDYTVDLTTGEITLLADPGDAVITCDAKGIKDGFDMSTGLKTGVYSENVADHLFFIFTVLNGITVANMDLASFLELQIARTQKIAWLLDTDTPTMEVNRLFQQSSIYHFLPLLNGTFAARYYRRIVPTGTMELQYYDFNGFTISDQAENVYYAVIVKYDKDPTTGIFKTVSTVDSMVMAHHSEKQTFEVETALRDASEAEAVMGFYATLLNAPADKLETDISMVGRNLLPTDKLKVSRSVEADSGEIVILAEEIYVLLETVKDLASGVVSIVAQLDSQLSIYAIHSDSPHQDEHSDHSDLIHGDASHSDHTDNVHADTPHVDNPHGDIDHDDYSDKVHEDIPHVDTPHADTPYVDTYSDAPHLNNAHSDHSDTQHEDSHVDISHIDSEV